MTQQPNEQDNKNADLSRLYQKASNEMPSSELDNNILWQAKHAANRTQTVSDNVGDEHAHKQTKKNPFWFKWQWGGSVAASALLLSVVWIVNTPEQELAYAPESEPQLELMDEPLSHALDASETLKKERVVETIVASETEKTINRSVLSSSPSMAIASDNTVLSTAILNADDKVIEEAESVPAALEELTAATSIDVARETEFGQSRQLLSTDMAASRMASDKVEVDSELNNLLQQAKRYQRALYNTEIQNAEDEKRLTDALTAVQVKLAGLIKVKKQQDPQWVVEPKYMNVLTPEQRKALMNAN